KGTLIHYILGQLGTERDLDRVLAKAIQNGDIAEEESDGLRTRIEQIILHPLLHPYYKEGITVFNEREILTKEGNILRPDRIVLYDDKTVIMDYKTGGKKPSHREQLFSYANALQEMGHIV